MADDLAPQVRGRLPTKRGMIWQIAACAPNATECSSRKEARHAWQGWLRLVDEIDRSLRQAGKLVAGMEGAT